MKAKVGFWLSTALVGAALVFTGVARADEPTAPMKPIMKIKFFPTVKFNAEAFKLLHFGAGVRGNTELSFNADGTGTVSGGYELDLPNLPLKLFVPNLPEKKGTFPPQAIPPQFLQMATAGLTGAFAAREESSGSGSGSGDNAGLPALRLDPSMPGATDLAVKVPEIVSAFMSGKSVEVEWKREGAPAPPELNRSGKPKKQSGKKIPSFECKIGNPGSFSFLGKDIVLELHLGLDVPYEDIEKFKSGEVSKEEIIKKLQKWSFKVSNQEPLSLKEQKKQRRQQNRQRGPAEPQPPPVRPQTPGRFEPPTPTS